MAKTRIHVGLEIGTTKTCMVVAEVKPDGSVKILGVGEGRSAGVRKGEIADFLQVKACVKSALLEAEDASDVEINSVFLAVTGSHIQGVNNVGTFRLPDNEKEVSLEHVEEVKEIAADMQLPVEHVYLHNLVRHFSLDGQQHANSPVGLIGRTLEADFHIVHGMETRIQNSIKCVRETPLDVDDVVFAPVASAQIALTKARKEAGAMVIDIGGGTTDYILYIDGAIAASGCVPVGGDHITNDIHLVTHVPLSKSEKLKVTEADVSGDPAKSVGTVKVTDDKGFPDVEVQRQELNDVARWRLEETFEIVRGKLPEGWKENVGTGVFLTGGTSLMNGIGELACEVFGLPVYRPERPEVSGVHAYFKDPQYSTALGLIRYAQILDEERPEKGGGLGTFFKALLPFGHR
ncbi:cell division protein FtsA [Roseibacillus persicicus]|uniref:Cell division protein FtsA n=1 Tax=Roseibacillus persicicus TaxID=454148 RepID=A0A918TT97_9BACT|nr:cell division protein FtsA [Roseibacillus persicicus]MDQ8191144.1 cell division protein FtsA [Roseibacillus persicicus]GHC59035.1 cell division protein FtsA [Roseibacillus persicicus]